MVPDQSSKRRKRPPIKEVTPTINAKQEEDDDLVPAKLLTVPYSTGVIASVLIIVSLLLNWLSPGKTTGLYWLFMWWINGIAVLVAKLFPSAEYSVAYLQENPTGSPRFEGGEIADVVFGSIPGMTILLVEAIAAYAVLCLIPALVVHRNRKGRFLQEWLDCMAWPGGVWSRTAFLVCSPIAGGLSVAAGVLLAIAAVAILPIAIAAGAAMSPLKFWGNQFGGGVLSGGSGVFGVLIGIVAAIAFVLAIVVGVMALFSWFFATLPMSLVVASWMASNNAVANSGSIGPIPVWLLQWLGCTIALSLLFVFAPFSMGYYVKFEFPHYFKCKDRELFSNWKGWPIDENGNVDPSMSWLNTLSPSNNLIYATPIFLSILLWRSTDAIPSQPVSGVWEVLGIAWHLFYSAFLPALIVAVIICLPGPPEVKNIRAKKEPINFLENRLLLPTIVGLPVVNAILAGIGHALPIIITVIHTVAFALAVTGVALIIRVYSAASRWSRYVQRHAARQSQRGKTTDRQNTKATAKTRTPDARGTTSKNGKGTPPAGKRIQPNRTTPHGTTNHQRHS